MNFTNRKTFAALAVAAVGGLLISAPAGAQLVDKGVRHPKLLSEHRQSLVPNRGVARSSVTWPKAVAIFTQYRSNMEGLITLQYRGVKV